MKNNIRNLTGLLFVVIFIISCATYKKEMYQGEGTIEQARMNAIIDFTNNNYKTPRKYLERRNGKPFDVFQVTERKIKKMQKHYVIGILPENDGHISLRSKDVIGKATDWFPTKFVELNGKLFLWHDSLVPLSKEVIEIIHTYGILDSISVKRDLGLLPEDFEDNRTISTDDKLKGVHYYFCKDDISKYKKVKTNIATGYYTPPKLDCSE